MNHRQKSIENQRTKTVTKIDTKLRKLNILDSSKNSQTERILETKYSLLQQDRESNKNRYLAYKSYDRDNGIAAHTIKKFN